MSGRLLRVVDKRPALGMQFPAGHARMAIDGGHLCGSPLIHVLEKNIWVIELDLGWNSSGNPILDSLYPATSLAEPKQFRDLGRATELFYLVFVFHDEQY